MQTVTEWTRRSNVARYRHDLQNGTNDSARHATMLNLLIEEERLLGDTREQLDEINRQVAHIEAIVASQLESIGALSRNGYSTEQAEAIVWQILDLLSVHKKRRAEIEAALPLCRSG